MLTCSGVVLLLFLSASGVSWTEKTGLELPQPYFEPSASSVVVRPGQTVQLPCRVRQLGDRIVSWIRRRDLHILASAGFTFTADERFTVLHPDGDSASWTLQLRAAVPLDQGLYECQVNTEPKLKQAVLLTVSDEMVSDDALELSMGDDASAGGSAHIQGPREQHVQAGTTWTLTCQVTGLRIPSRTDSATPPRLVDWLHEGRLLTYQSRRGGVSVDTEHAEGLTVSRLTLTHLSTADTGRYACKPLSLPPTVVTVIVLEGEKTAMLERSAALGWSPSWPLVTVLVLLCASRVEH